MSIETRLNPPPGTGHTSVARLTDYWYIACASDELGRGLLARQILGVPLVLFRTRGGAIGALLDRCPHRNVPLSVGEMVGETLQCGYHGWEFAPDGACTRVPGLCGDADHKGRRATAYPVTEQDGYVWVFLNPDVEPDVGPYALPHASTPGYTTVRKVLDVECSVHAAIENALDVPHTAFLHKGLFRGSGEPNTIQVVIRRWRDRAEAEFIGEPRPEGLAGRLLSPSGGIVTHFDRFIMPSIAQVEYRLGEENHIVVTSNWTPISDFETRMFAAISYRLRLPGWVVEPLVEPIVSRIFAQDAAILKLQTDTIKRFGGERFVSTEIDVLGPHIWRLMTQAERGNLPAEGAEPFTKEITLRV